MGLDQYAYATAWTLEELEDRDKETPLEELAYWRKHNRLQGWMENLWHEKLSDGRIPMKDDYLQSIWGSPKELVFNCVYLPLTSEDIDNLERAVNNKDLPETSGFFFGGDSYHDYEQYDKKTDVMFIEKARQALKQGLTIYYSCWW